MSDEPNNEPTNNVEASVGGVTQTVTATLPIHLLFKHPRYYELVVSASHLREDHPEAAVVMAQSAVEVFVARAFDALLIHHGVDDTIRQPLARCIPDHTFQDRETCRLWHALTGERIKTAPTWKRFDEEVERRNRVIHAGEAVTPVDATAAIEACVGLIKHMQDVLRRLLRPND
ncbi:MAG TPA: hypothetical protein VES79_00020 [Solirubrobacteraceae bacterium]|nr:hypothetical protein [Solirubrobacteraceae bacterium]